MNNFLLLGSILLLVSGPLRGQLVGDVFPVHDPSIIKAGEDYYVFSTGDGIPIRRSGDLVHWQLIGRVFNLTPDWFSSEVPKFKKSIWAPDISYFGGQYHLYYAISSFGSNRSCIGLAVNRTLDPASPDYHWDDEGPVVRSIPGKNNWNAIDPNLVIDRAKRPWLAFGSFWGGIELVPIDPATGKLPEPPPHYVNIAKRPKERAEEAPFIVWKAGYYYLFVSFDYCSGGTGSTYKIMVGRSKDIRGPYVDRAGVKMLDGGGTLVLAGGGRVCGPGHNAVLFDGGSEFLVHHMLDAFNGCEPTLQIRPITWSDDGWPEPGECLGLVPKHAGANGNVPAGVHDGQQGTGAATRG